MMNLIFVVVFLILGFRHEIKGDMLKANSCMLWAIFNLVTYIAMKAG